jgi:3,4-dihydroxy 2-butanone 4-phosphate synthase/GTP cyclohydrolase II
LQESLRRLAASPGGILVYLRGHEGRGIGLANKMRAYALQDKGMDTVDANRALGLPEDARDYAEAAQILRALGAQQVRLLTNNPDKVMALCRQGIEVSAVEPLVIAANPFNAGYLDTKARKFGHVLPLTHP